MKFLPIDWVNPGYFFMFRVLDTPSIVCEEENLLNYISVTLQNLIRSIKKMESPSQHFNLPSGIFCLPFLFCLLRRSLSNPMRRGVRP